MLNGSLSWWEWIGIVWIALGLVAVCALEFASRSSDQRGPLSQGSILSSIGYSGALIAGVPFVLLFSLGVCFQMLWQGRIPITRHIWWPARVAKFERTNSDMRPSRETILVQMIEVRRRRDPRLRRTKPASNWPMFQLWETPEATILDTSENFRWLKDAGLTDQSALERLESFASENASPSLNTDVTLLGYVARRLKMVAPSYLSLSDDILIQQIEIADKWVENEIQRIKSEPAFPPTEWLEKRISVDDIERDMSSICARASVPSADPGPNPLAGPNKNWNRLKARMTEGDELWKFNSPREYWEGLAGRRGIALIRDGRSIAHIVTVMN